MSNNVSNGTTSNETTAISLSIPDIIQIVLLTLTILLAFGYTALIVLRPTFRHNKHNWFTVNICLCSALFCLVTLATNVLQAYNASDEVPCRVRGFLISLSVCQLLYSHCVASISRLLVVVYANKRFYRSTGCTWIFIGSGWLVATLVATPYLFLDGFTCPKDTQAQSLIYYSLAATLILPIVIIAVSNCRLLWFVRRSTRQVHAGMGRNRVSHARDVHLMKVLIATFAVVVIGWSPIFILQALIGNVSIPHAVNTAFQMLPCFSMLFDVCLLIYTNQPVRLFLKQQLLRRVQIAPATPTNAHKH